MTNSSHGPCADQPLNEACGFSFSFRHRPPLAPLQLYCTRLRTVNSSKRSSRFRLPRQTLPHYDTYPRTVFGSIPPSSSALADSATRFAIRFELATNCTAVQLLSTLPPPLRLALVCTRACVRACAHPV